jgi:hypothetical protein
MTPEEALRGGPPLEDEGTDGSSSFGTDVEGSIVSVGGIGALGVADGWDGWKCEELI